MQVSPEHLAADFGHSFGVKSLRRLRILTCVRADGSATAYACAIEPPCDPQARTGMTMRGTTILNPNPPEFERFLFASVGEDRNGSAVTVLSALARLELDPWSESADLAILGDEAAHKRLGELLAKFKDVPSLGNDHGKMAKELSLLLPEQAAIRSFNGSASLAMVGRCGPGRALWTILAFVFVLFQLWMLVGSGVAK